MLSPTSLLRLSACALMAFAACDDATPAPVAAYSINFTSSPAAIIPQRAATLSLQLTAGGHPELGATVTGKLVSSTGTTVDAGTFAGDDGAYVAQGVMMPEAGEWTLEVAITGSLGAGAASFPLAISCDGGGALGAGCCASDGCDSGFCVYGQCAAGPGAADQACYEADECGSAVCTSGVCAAASCNDGITNGAETAEDCGGECAACALGSTCGADADCASNQCLVDVCGVSVPVLGGGTHSLANVQMTAIALGIDGLATPRDLEFEPGTFHLWVINRVTESVTVLFWAGTDSQSAQTYWGGGANHFAAQPAAIAFGETGTMATIHETDAKTQGPNGSPGDFMGPTLHSTDLSIFNSGTQSHLDMLHNSPNGMGIAWDEGNIYWVFDGAHGSITRYDFKIDHGPGGTDHSDGTIRRYVEGEVKRVADVPSHMEIDQQTKLLYVADTGNNRIAVLDTKMGEVSGSLSWKESYDGLAEFYSVSGGVLTTLIDCAAVGMQHPSGLMLMDDLIVVSDNATGIIYAFDKASGDQVDYLDTGLGAGALMGMTHREGAIYFTDAVGQRVMRLEPRP